MSGTGVVPFTPASAIEMQNASETINNLMASLENYYDAARNAMLVKKAVRKYGKTQSIIALIGQEGLAAAQTFSMEGFWQKTKDFLWKIWSKIKEWWGRFWGMFFSIEDKLRNFESSLSNRVLVEDCEFDAPKYADIEARSTKAKTAITDLETASKKENPTTADFDKLLPYLGDTQDAEINDNYTFPTVHHKYTNITAIKDLAKKLSTDIFAKHRTDKKDIDTYTDNFLRHIKNLKVGDFSGVNKGTNIPVGSRRDEFNRLSSHPKAGDDASAESNDMAIKMIKTAAKVNNKMVSQVLKGATVLGVKLMANTRTRNAS